MLPWREMRGEGSQFNASPYEEIKGALFLGSGTFAVARSVLPPHLCFGLAEPRIASYNLHMTAAIVRN